MVDYISGVLQICVLFLSIIAGIIAVSLFKVSGKGKELESWRYLIVVLVLFALEMIVGALRSFDIFSTPYLTHIIPSFILVILIAALLKEIEYLRYWYKPCPIRSLKAKKSKKKK